MHCTIYTHVWANWQYRARITGRGSLANHTAILVRWPFWRLFLRVVVIGEDPCALLRYVSWYFRSFWTDFSQTNFISSCKIIHFKSSLIINSLLSHKLIKLLKRPLSHFWSAPFNLLLASPVPALVFPLLVSVGALVHLARVVAATAAAGLRLFLSLSCFAVTVRFPWILLRLQRWGFLAIGGLLCFRFCHLVYNRNYSLQFAFNSVFIHCLGLLTCMV